MNANYWAEEADRLHIKWIKALTDLETLKAENNKLNDALVNCWSYSHAVTADNTALCRLRDALYKAGDTMAKDHHTHEAQAWRAIKEKSMNRYSDVIVDKKPPLQ